MSRVVRLRLFGFLERLAGHREACLEVEDNATLLHVLLRLAERYGTEFASAIFRAPRQVHTHLRLFMNDEPADVNDPIAAAGNQEPEVMILVLNSVEGG